MPKDKAYSLLGLFDNYDEHGALALLDYSLPWIEVFARVALSILSTYKNLDFLSFCSTFIGDMDYLPSWVPALHNPSFCLPLVLGIFDRKNSMDIFTACGTSSMAHLPLKRNDCLSLCGKRFGAVSWTMKLPEELHNSDPNLLMRHSSLVMQDLCNQLDRIQSHQQVDTTSQSAAEIRWRTFLADQWLIGTRLQSTTYKGCAVLLTSLEKERALLDQLDPSTALQFLKGRSIFTTKSGHLGLGPSTTAPGDIVIVAEGGAVPYILRAEPSTFYRFVGEW